MALSEYQIQYLNITCRESWTETNGIIDAYCVDFSGTRAIDIPVQFGQINGNFECRSNILTTLKGAASIVHGYFVCGYNNLTTLENGPARVDTWYVCINNKLTNLIGAPEICNDNFYCHHNQLTSLEGCPKIIKGDLYCYNNPELNILYGIGRVEGKIQYDQVNDLNEWIISRARTNIFLTYYDIVKWIKSNNRFEFLIKAPQQIRNYFLKKMLNDVDLNIF